MSEKTIAALVADLEAARDLYGSVSREAMAARRAETDALNHLNEVSRELKLAMEKLRQTMPYESDLRRNDRQSLTVPA